MPKLQSRAVVRKSISKDQIKALRTAAAKVFREESDYRDFLAQNFAGITSTKDLDMHEAGRAITLLRKHTGYKEPRFEGQGTGKRITDSQARKIAALVATLGWTNKGLFQFIERQTGKKCDVPMLLKHEASKLIVGLQRVAAKGSRETYRKLNTTKPGDVDAMQ
jgi:hypothetical protein